MKKTKVLLVDDESLGRQRLRRMLDATLTESTCEEAKNGTEALEKIHEFCPDIVFLDIQMPDLTGFEVLQQLEDRPFALVFQTAYDQHALKAFDENAVDYLLKPYTLERFQKALEKALEKRPSERNLKHLESSLLREKQFLERIVAKQGGKTKVIEASEVSCFLSQDHYTFLYAGLQEYVIDLSLNWLEERLDPTKFLRCHRNTIVALKEIRSVGNSQESSVLLKSGRTLSASRNGRKKLLELLK